MPLQLVIPTTISSAECCTELSRIQRKADELEVLLRQNNSEQKVLSLAECKSSIDKLHTLRAIETALIDLQTNRVACF